jgi:DHA2 family multidrug resistance protein
MTSLALAVPKAADRTLAQALVIAGAILASMLFIFYSAVIAVALPQISGNTGASADEGVWILDAFLLASVIAIPVAPWLQTRFGRRRIVLIALVGFGVSTLLCGLADSPAELMTLRFAQGAFGGLLAPLSQAILRDSLPSSQLHFGQMLFGISVGVGGSLAPYFGGLIADDLSWQSIFFVGIPPIAAATIVFALLLKDHAAQRRVPFDLVGLTLLVVFLSALLDVLVEGERWDWFDDVHNVEAAILAVTGCIAFIVWELRSAHPVVDLRVLQRGNVAAGSFLAAAFGFGLYGLYVIEPDSTQVTLGLTATLSGVLVMVQNLAGTAVMPPISSLLSQARVTPRTVLAAGFAVLGAGCFMIANATATTADFGTFIVPMLVAGIGSMLVFTPLPAVVIGGLRSPADVATAAAFFNVSRILGGALGIAMIGTVTDQRFAYHQSVLAASVTLARPVVAAVAREPGKVMQLAGLVAAQSQALAEADAFRVIGVIAFLSLPFVLCLKRPRAEAHGA